MVKVIKFSKVFTPMVILSSVLITLGIVGLFTKGINYGIDFQAGFIEKVRVAPTALTLQYNGGLSVAVSQSSSGIDFVATGVGDNNETFNFPYAKYPTVGDFASAVASVQGVTATIVGPATVSLKSVFPDSEVLARLSAIPYRFHFVPSDAAVITPDEVRKMLAKTYPNASVQIVGLPADRFFQVRLADDGTDPQASVNLRAGLNKAFADAYGEENVAVISTDFVGSQFSASLASQSFWLVMVTLLLILGYCAIRFRWDFAVGGVLAIAHDALIMIAFIVWTRMQFNSSTIAAVLTILGYSINDTVVIFDRIRDNMKLHPEMKIKDILDLSQTEMLGRTIITTIATMLAVSSLYFFTSGDMKEFALALLVGMTSGVYSTIYIASAFINAVRRWVKTGTGKEKVKIVTSGEVV